MAAQVLQEAKPNKNFSCYMSAQSGLYYGAAYNKNGEKLEDEHLLNGEQILQGKEAKFCFMEEAFLPFGVSLTPQILLEVALAGEKNNNIISAKDISIKYIRRSAAEEAK